MLGLIFRSHQERESDKELEAEAIMVTDPVWTIGECRSGNLAASEAIENQGLTFIPSVYLSSVKSY